LIRRGLSGGRGLSVATAGGKGGVAEPVRGEAAEPTEPTPAAARDKGSAAEF